ncbi:MAG: type II toxin-antitoxin system CcdA family antitoxin [Propionivibrio sp.]|jgi:antitoxin CcdA|nr:type II toxin-antitoxin system CcdA family antitoxin [Propionivibrio sp.]
MCAGLGKPVAGIHEREEDRAAELVLPVDRLQTAEAGLREVLAEKRAELWSLENASAFICWNDYIEKNGLPLEKHSSF